MTPKIVLSGIQPSGDLHIGNYIGMIQQMVSFQMRDEVMLFAIVDLHAITVRQDPKLLKQNIRSLTALYLACGVDPEESKIFIQSENPDHAYLAWVFDCMIPMGWMERMTQYKDKSLKQGERTSIGLFSYPALMAADILLYDCPYVPVGEDQTQHIELTRDIAHRFNKEYGEVFVIPEIALRKGAARIMSLVNPEKKMSKSDLDPKGTINLLDNPDAIGDKIAKAVTDSGSEVAFRPDKPALSNLLTIYSELSGEKIDLLENRYAGRSYSEFKNDLSEVVINTLKPIQNRYHKIISESGYLDTIFDQGRDFSQQHSSKKVAVVRQLIGLGR